jgi:hypothetical protein
MHTKETRPIVPSVQSFYQLSKYSALTRVDLPVVVTDVSILKLFNPFAANVVKW